ncbi:AAA family ATPase [Methylorubrum thiocyanatum]|uniref:AAA family ATPase n=1 Tax=Methylorubrum thiocyanatum TaxID=47958 RepID=UPI0035C7C07C
MNSTKKTPRKYLENLTRTARGDTPNGHGGVAGTPSAELGGDASAFDFLMGDTDEQHEAQSVPLSSPIHTLAEAALTSALTAAQRRRMAGAPHLSVLIEAPTAAWVQPLRRAVAAMGSWAKVDARDVARRPKLRPDEGEAELVELLGSGQRVAVVSWLPERYVPRSYLDAVDLRIHPGHPSVSVLRRVIREATGTRPRRMPASVQGLDHPDFAAAIRVGDTAAAAVRRLEAVARARTLPTGDLDDVPLVKDLVGLGEAGVWARHVVASVEAWRRGEGPWPAGSLNACLASPPGLGKTTLLKSLGKSCGLPVVTTSVASWFAGSGYLDDVLRRMQEDLLRASSAAPCILYFDEADALPSRADGDDRHASYWMPILGALLSFTDGLGLHGADASRIIIVAATNAAHRIDTALLRPGRLGRVIRIVPPDAEALDGILRQHLRGDLADADLDGVVAVGLGATGAEARAWVEVARLKARIAGRPMAIGDLLHEAAPPDGRSATALWRCAAHEAGHAVAVAKAGGGRIRRISILAHGQTGGRTVVTPTDGTVMSPEDMEAIIVGLLGGRAAEEALDLGISTGAHNDLGEATALATARRASYGMAGSLVRRAPVDRATGLLEKDPDLRDAVEADLQRLYGVSLALIREHRTLVEALARLLVAQRVVDEGAFLKLVEAEDRARVGAGQGGPHHG